MINDPLIVLKDRLNYEIKIYASEKGVGWKDGGLRDLHVQMFDMVKTERECISIRDQSKSEIDRLAELPKEPTLEEQVLLIRKEINELKTG